MYPTDKKGIIKYKISTNTTCKNSVSHQSNNNMLSSSWKKFLLPFPPHAVTGVEQSLCQRYNFVLKGKKCYILPFRAMMSLMSICQLFRYKTVNNLEITNSFVITDLRLTLESYLSMLPFVTHVVCWVFTGYRGQLGARNWLELKKSLKNDSRVSIFGQLNWSN